MIDGIVFADCCCVVALAITTNGTKVPSGWRRLVRSLSATFQGAVGLETAREKPLCNLNGCP